jgi:hypothetical protein
MKKIVLNVTIFAMVIGVILILLVSFGSDEGSKYVYKNNREHKIIEIKPGEYQCSECNMDIGDLDNMAELIAENGNTYFFDDIGCVVLWLKTHSPKIARLMTKTLDTHQWIAVEKAWYSRTARTPMGYGFAPYAVKQKGFVSYDEMKMLMLQGKNLHDPFVKKQLLSREVR